MLFVKATFVLCNYITKSSQNITEAVEHWELEVEADGLVDVQTYVKDMYMCWQGISEILKCISVSPVVWLLGRKILHILWSEHYNGKHFLMDRLH